MRKANSRLLILLVLVPVFVAAFWTTVHASVPAGPSTADQSSMSARKPGATPTSGEPDIGQTTHPVTTTRGIMTTSPPVWDIWVMGHPIREWFRWTGRVEAARYLGRR